MKVLLSIKPEYVEKIFSGEKKYEYRRLLFKHSVSSIVVYASAPISKVVGEFSIEDIIYLDKDLLWNTTKRNSGISIDKYSNYFHDKEMAYAIKIGNLKKYKRPLKLKELNIERPPQSFMYIS
ncbi:hypothetical protein [Leptospira stimsonii]|uniref:ASCH domain-containing protein n=1 Tax=Leptospira stimsonii TaxID=2202203 RepID=A0ABY2MWD7_9LEPT|nr:hypothetical protein [Leptospira stimsonii]TGK17596.1 hypothetical protein EHO98_13975 [Leptospira stimsonii]TGM10296.1 hypothetical protein EHQ90_19125 [Leptospira stimsonii]